MAQETAAEPTARKRSETARAFAEDGPRKTHVGGQALIEGVMMRGKFNWAVAVREPDGGMYVEDHDLASGRAKNGWMHWPVVRGCRAFVESLMLGYKALEIAAMHAFADEEGEPEEKKFSWKDDFGNPDEMIDALGAQRTLEVVCEPESETETAGVRDVPAEPVGEEGSSDEGFGKKEMAVSMVLGLVLGVVLFIVAPAFITNLVVGEYDSDPVLWNIFDGILRVLVFVFYIWLIGRMEEIKRMFS